MCGRLEHLFTFPFSIMPQIRIEKSRILHIFHFHPKTVSESYLQVFSGEGGEVTLI